MLKEEGQQQQPETLLPNEDLNSLLCDSVTPVTTACIEHAGVSVEYVHNLSYQKNEGYQWYAMVATYQREKQAAEYLAEHGIQVFYPTKIVETAARNAHGRIKTKEHIRSLIPSTFFVYTDFETAEQFVRYRMDSPVHLDYLRFMYDKTQFRELGKNPPLTIPTPQMDNFIDLFSREIEGTDVVDPSIVRFRPGDEIIVTGGEFKGIHGRVARIHNQTRVIVTLDGICLAATTYVPKKYIQPLDKQ